MGDPDPVKSRAGRHTRKARIVPRRYRVVPIDYPKAHPDNARKGNVEEVASSIVENGFYGDILVQKRTGLIGYGEHRWRAAKVAGLATIPVLEVDIDDAALLRIVTVDNATSDKADYDRPKLAEVLERIDATQRTLRGTGYTEGDLARLMKKIGRSQKAAKNTLPPPATPFTLQVECKSSGERDALELELRERGLEVRAL